MKNKYRLITSLLFCVLLVPIYLPSGPVSGGSSQGTADVYILALSDVPCHVNGWPESNDYKNQCVSGAIEAVSFQTSASLPLVHPKYGNSQPFYAVNYSVITDWYTYSNVVQYRSNFIVVNTHGEILPVPSSFSSQGWMAVIADAVLNRSAVWVHTAGYPFYYIWYQGQSQSTLWTGLGFQNFTQYIGMDTVSCFAPGDDTTPVEISDYASNMLTRGWPNIGSAYYAEEGRPLNSATFKNYTVYPIWGSTIDYMTGAVITFVNPGQRYEPGQHSGFGAYVHIGTRNITDAYYHNVYSPNYMRGYVGCAAALAVVVQRFDPVTADTEFAEAPSDHSELGVSATSVISNWNSYTDATNHTNSHWAVDVDYVMYGCLKTNGTGALNQIEFYVSSPFACQIWLFKNESLDAHKDDSGTMLNLLTSTGLVALDVLLLLAPDPEPGTKLWALVQLVNGVQLFRDISDMTNTMHDIVSGTNSASCTFATDISETNSGGYTFYEFEASVRVHVEFGFGIVNRWNVLPLNFATVVDWKTGVNTAHQLIFCSDSDVCYQGFHTPLVSSPHNTTIFFDDFQDGLASWTAGDSNQDYGLDYWGTYTGNEGNAQPCVYCAEVGNNSLHGNMPNVDVGTMGMYDRGMESVLSMPLDLKAYQSASTRFKVACWFGSGTYLAVESFTDGGWVLLKNYTSDGSTEIATSSLSNAATCLRFRFHSSDSSDGGQSSLLYPAGSGAWVYFVELDGLLPNDANSGNDANESLSQPLQISPNTFYEGYLEFDEDTYSFSVTPSDISNHRTITATITPQVNCIFTLNLYNPSQNPMAGPSSLLMYTFTSGDAPGNWILQVPHATKGFGRYSFSLFISDSGGGGCPYLYDWNGSNFAKDNNILPTSEINGSNTRDYYLLQQPLVPLKSARQWSLYLLQIGEFENNVDYIDQVRLKAVDHSQGTCVAVTQNGGIITYENPAPPFSCVDDQGNSELAQVNSMNGNVSDPSTFYEGNRGSWLLLDFGSVNGSYANLILRDDWKCPECIYVQVPDQGGGWQNVTVLNPRDFWSTEAVDMAAYIPSNADFIVRLYWTQTHRLDFVGLDTSSPAQIQVYSASPLLAIHSNLGVVTSKLLNGDENYVELVNGQQITIAFTLASQAEGTTRDFIFYTDGYYR